MIPGSVAGDLLEYLTGLGAELDVRLRRLELARIVIAPLEQYLGIGLAIGGQPPASTVWRCPCP